MEENFAFDLTFLNQIEKFTLGWDIEHGVLVKEVALAVLYYVYLVSPVI